MNDDDTARMVREAELRKFKFANRRKGLRARPTCHNCNRYADRERDNKGKFYVKCHGCGYDSRFGPQP